MLGFDFVEMLVDEIDDCLLCFNWSCEQCLVLVNVIVEIGVCVLFMCFFVYCCFLLGSEDDAVWVQGLEIMCKVIQFVQDVGICVIQLVGYDVYYQEVNNEMCCCFCDGLKESVEMVSCVQVMLVMEIMDYLLMSFISKVLGYVYYFNNLWFQFYLDIGNLLVWDNDVQMELQVGIGYIVVVYVKDIKSGVFKNVLFGEGVVDFECCFEMFKQSGYCGLYLIEMWSEMVEDLVVEVVKVCDWVKVCMVKVGMVEVV